MTGLLITLIIYGLIFYVIWWAIGALGIPEPFNKVVRVIVILLVGLTPMPRLGLGLSR